ncbi:MAG: XisI protein [Cyanobacteria bacterium J06626_18]
MDRVDSQKQAVRSVLTHYQTLNEKSDLPTESALIYDEDRGHYLIMLMGWNRDERVKNTQVHVRLKGGKVWIEEDWTEDGVATGLLEAGIRKDEIVLAFHPPHLRQHTEFAAA